MLIGPIFGSIIARAGVDAPAALVAITRTAYFPLAGIDIASGFAAVGGVVRVVDHVTLALVML